MPVTEDEVPAVQRLVDGADDTVVPLDDPQLPLIAVTPVGNALFDPGKTGTPPGTLTRTISTFATRVLSFGTSLPICTTLVPATSSVTGMVSGYVRHDPTLKGISLAGYGYGIVWSALPFTLTRILFGLLFW